MSDRPTHSGITVPLLWRRLAAASCAVAAIGCSSIPAPTEQLTRAEAAVQRAEQTRDVESAALSLRRAQDALSSAQTAMHEGDYIQAQMQAERAQVDAELALSQADSTRAKRSADDLANTIDVMRQEIRRVAPGGAR
jgi:hypothetical protein